MSIEKSLYEQLEKQFVQANNEKWQLVEDKTKLQLRNNQLEYDYRILRDAYTALQAGFEAQKTQIQMLKELDNSKHLEVQLQEKETEIKRLLDLINEFVNKIKKTV